jgi:hypothetical protein
MAEKPSKKLVSITIKRERPAPPRVIVATGFRLRSDKSTGLLEVILETAGKVGERVTFDPIVMRSNVDMLKRYVAETAASEDDAAQKEDLNAGETATFANMVHFTRMGGRAETIFGLFSLSDWVEATRHGKSDGQEIKSYDNLVAVSTVGFQKKLLLELVLLLHPQEKE